MAASAVVPSPRIPGPLGAGWVLAAAPGELRRRALGALGIAVGGAGVLSVVCLPEGPTAWWRALELQRRHAASGHASWVLGIQSMHCLPWCFPFAWLVKTPIALVLATGRVAAVGLVAWLGTALLLVHPDAITELAGSSGRSR